MTVEPNLIRQPECPDDAPITGYIQLYITVAQSLVVRGQQVPFSADQQAIGWQAPPEDDDCLSYEQQVLNEEAMDARYDLIKQRAGCLLCGANCEPLILLGNGGLPSVVIPQFKISKT